MLELYDGKRNIQDVAFGILYNRLQSLKVYSVANYAHFFHRKTSKTCFVEFKYRRSELDNIYPPFFVADASRPRQKWRENELKKQNG